MSRGRVVTASVWRVSRPAVKPVRSKGFPQRCIEPIEERSAAPDQQSDSARSGVRHLSELWGMVYMS